MALLGLFTTLVFGSPVNIGFALESRAENFTTNEICFLTEYAVLFGGEGWFQFTVLGMEGDRQALLKYNSSCNNQTLLSSVDRGLLKHYNYDDHQDYCGEGRVDTFFDLVSRALNGALRMRSTLGLARRDDQSDCEETKCINDGQCLQEAGNKCAFCWETVFGEGPNTCAWVEDTETNGDRVVRYYETGNFQDLAVQQCSLLGSCGALSIIYKNY